MVPSPLEGEGQGGGWPGHNDGRGRHRAADSALPDAGGAARIPGFGERSAPKLR